jgi:hypothetical protein
MTINNQTPFQFDITSWKRNVTVLAQSMILLIYLNSVQPGCITLVCENITYRNSD